MSDDDISAGSSDQGAFPPGGIPLMAPPPMSGGFGAAGLPPPNPGRASGGTKVRVALRLPFPLLKYTFFV